MSALSISNYEINNAVKVKRIEKENARSIVLVTSDLFPADYRLKVHNVKSRAGVSLDGRCMGFF